MTSAKRGPVRIGDVFVVPLAEDLQVYGQVLDQSGRQFLVVLFRPATGSIADVSAGGIELAGIIFDVKLKNGDWPIIANQVPVEVRSPWFVTGHPQLGDFRLTNFDGSVKRPTTTDEASMHRNRTIATPMALQLAAEAVHQRRDWQPELDCFRELAAELRTGRVA